MTSNNQFNEELCSQVRDGKLAIENTGDEKQIVDLLQYIFPTDDWGVPKTKFFFVKVDDEGYWDAATKTDLPTRPVSDFFVAIPTPLPVQEVDGLKNIIEANNEVYLHRNYVEDEFVPRFIETLLRKGKIKIVDGQEDYFKTLKGKPTDLFKDYLTPLPVKSDEKDSRSKIELGKRLKELRGIIPMLKVFEETGVPVDYLERLEDGVKIYTPSTNALYKLASYYNCDLKELLKLGGIIIPKKSDDKEAKEKARELVEKFKEHCLQYDVSTDNWGHYGGRDINKEDTMDAAKQCALIACDLLIAENTEIENMVGQGFNLDFWQQVRHQIQSM